MMTWFLRALVWLGFVGLAGPAFAHDDACAQGLPVAGSSIATLTDLVALRKAHPKQRLIVRGARLEHARFDRLDLSNICFIDSSLAGSSWRRARGDGLRFRTSDLTDTLWMGFRGSGVEFDGSRLTKASLGGATMPGVSFATTSLEHADARRADFRGGSFVGNWSSWLTGARFDQADLRGFRFVCGLSGDDGCGQYSEAFSFRGADLRGAELDMPSFAGLDFTGARIADTRIHWKQVNWFRVSRLEGAVVVTPPRWAPLASEHDRLEVALNPAELRRIWRAYDATKEPSFSCRAASSPTERLICIDRYQLDYYDPFDGAARLAERDRELAAAFAAARGRPGLVRDQLAWLRQRDACAASGNQDGRFNCLNNAYAARIDQLWALAGGKAKLGRGASQLYVETALSPATLGDRVLYRKLAPLWARSSSQFILVRRDGHGRLFATGGSVGANYHLGDLSSPGAGLTYDPASQCYVGTATNGSEQMPVIRLRSNAVDPGTECPQGTRYNDYITAGARAGFARLYALELDRKQLAQLQHR